MSKMRPINIAIEISPLLTASGIAGDKSGVYRYMVGLIQSFVANEKKYGKILLFSFNKDAFLSQINPDYIDLFEHSRVKLVKVYKSDASEPKMESFVQKYLLTIPVVKTLLRFLNKIVKIKRVYKNIADRRILEDYLRYLDKEFQNNHISIIFHSETGFFPIKGYKNIMTVYDLTPLMFKTYHQEETISLHKRKFYFVKDHCEGIICISNSTKKNLLQYCPQLLNRAICVLYPGLDNYIQAFYRNKSQEDVFPDLKLLSSKQGQQIENKQYLLYYGTFEPRKNLLYLVRSFIDLQKQKQIPASFKLVMVGGNGWGNIKKLINDFIKEHFPLSEKNNILIFDFLGDQFIYSLISHAYTVIYPSLYEGFGLPVLESMYLGTPVICSNNSSLPEAGGNAALYIDANDISDLQNAIKRIIRNKSLATTLSKRGKQQSNTFSWKKSSDKMYTFLHSLESVNSI